MVITPDAAGDALRQWVVEHPLSVPCLPRIDESGALAGVVLCNAQHHTPSVEVQPTTLRADQPLDELFDVFNTNKIDYLVVVDAQQQPLGYISSECLGNLVFDQFDPARYRVAETSLGPLASLVVPVTPEVSPSGAALAT
jgi:CBS-domain-containing membrane protein